MSSTGLKAWLMNSRSNILKKSNPLSERLHDMCLETVGNYRIGRLSGRVQAQRTVQNRLIEHSWKNDDMHIYGRFDLLVEPSGAIKMYEYNADTPTALLEAAVAQWQWLEEVEGVSHRDQFNSIHEKLVARWNQAKPKLADADALSLGDRKKVRTKIGETSNIWPTRRCRAAGRFISRKSKTSVIIRESRCLSMRRTLQSNTLLSFTRGNG